MKTEELEQRIGSLLVAWDMGRIMRNFGEPRPSAVGVVQKLRAFVVESEVIASANVREFFEPDAPQAERVLKEVRAEYEAFRAACHPAATPHCPVMTFRQCSAEIVSLPGHVRDLGPRERGPSGATGERGPLPSDPFAKLKLSHHCRQGEHQIRNPQPGADSICQ